MNDLIKDNSLIISKKVNNTGGFDFLLRNETKLGQILDYLPSGIINKTETGIGATSLELKSERNSIIVLPTIQTAKSKATNDIHYFSSESSLKIRVQGKEDLLNEYLKKMEGRFKKFTVVADSLPKLLLTLGEHVYEDYFLLLDEIDSIQKDSTFRKRMETCMEYYKMFHKDKRAVVSATIIAFSDPMFENGGLTNFKYEKSKKSQITFVETNTLLESATELIIEQIGDSKIVVAINEIDSAVSIANYLVKGKYLEYKDISVLCGRSPKNKEKIVKFSSLGIQENNYPSKLNFITSAYFTGYDIDESYKLIVISNPTMNHLRLSEFEIKQIIGRCRKPKELISIKVVYSQYVKPEYREEENVEKLKQFAKKEIEAIKCITSHYESDELGKQKAETMRLVLAKNSGFANFNFIFKNINNEYVISFLNIDAYVEDQRVKNTVYKNANYLVNYFKKLGHKTNKVEHYSSLLIEEPSAKKEKNKNLHQKVIEFLFSKRNITEEQINAYIKDGNKFEISCCEFFIKASKKLTNPKIKKYLKEADSIKKLIELNMAFDAFYENKNAFIKRNILAEFPINSVFLTDDLNQRIYDLVVKKLKQVEPSSYSNSNGKKLIKSYVQLKKTSVKLNEINAVAYRVLSHNPKKFPKKYAKFVTI